MPPKNQAANAPNPNTLPWAPASESAPGNLRFTTMPHPEFKADMAATIDQGWHIKKVYKQGTYIQNPVYTVMFLCCSCTLCN